ncbi:hypothetical protein [Rubrivirga sp. IMCC45206]|uniref:hypothetical protein n=1 Tax=Rubrivirga sp. IMCC45206 TaxID=3391614 RepID=UPI00398FB28A
MTSPTPVGDDASAAPASVRDDLALYASTGVMVATFVGGPIAGGYLLAHNFRVLGQEEEARRTLYGTLAALIAGFGALALLPDAVLEMRWTSAVLPAVWTAGAAAVFDGYQKEPVGAHVEAGGRKGSGWRMAGAILGGIAVTLVVGALLFSMTPPFDGERLDVGEQGGAIYYTGTASEADARAAADVLVEAGYDLNAGLYANLVGDARGLDLWLLLDPDAADDPTLLLEVAMLGEALEARADRPVQVSLVTEDLGGRRLDVLHGFQDGLPPPPPAPSSTPPPAPPPAPPPPPPGPLIR